MGLVYHLKRAVPSVLISSVCFSAIFFDYKHTQEWKKTIALEKSIIEKVKTVQQ